MKPATRLALSCLLVLAGARPAGAQTCSRPPASCAGALHCGGEWDFESGFYAAPHALAGQCEGPPGGGNVFCVPGDKVSTLGNGWLHWASFPDWPTGGYWGTCSFNENKNCENVFRGNRSQELTLTCANGVGVIYKTAAVPANHRIRVEADMKFTPNGAAPDVEHAIGIDPSGGTNPAAPGVQWTVWQELTPSPPQPGGVFNHGTAEAISQGPAITVMIRQRAFEPPCMGQTFLVDNVRVVDLGPAIPSIHLTAESMSPTAVDGLNAPPQTFTISNGGAGSLNYTITDDAGWLSAAPAAGTVTGEMDEITVTFMTAELPIGPHGALIHITSPEAQNSPRIIPVTLTVTARPADLDGDADVDQSDFGIFQGCLSGPSIPHDRPDCADADLDDDADVDSTDFNFFLGCLSGADTPSDPDCAP